MVILNIWVAYFGVQHEAENIHISFVCKDVQGSIAFIVLNVGTTPDSTRR